MMVSNRRARCVCLFRPTPVAPHSQRCPMHRDEDCVCACHLTDKIKRGHDCSLEQPGTPA